MVYDAQTGEIRDDRKFMSMLEDYWLPRREGSKGTEISTLSGAQNLGELADIIYFQKKLYHALNVPVSRLEQDKGIALGRSSEINRDELKFSKFITRLRSKFNELIFDILRKQILLKNIITADEWNSIKEVLFLDYLKDSYYVETKNAELRKQRSGELNELEKYIGKYYSHYWIRSQVLGMTEGEMREMDKQMTEERNKGMYPSTGSSI